MKIKLHFGDDYIIFEGETVEEIREDAFRAIKNRGISESICWSEVMEE